MAGVIVVTGREAATNTDILQGTRLQTAPAAGTLTLEMQASANSAANNHVTSLQLPDGQNPFDSLIVPEGVTDGGINQDDKVQGTFAFRQGGHAVFATVLTGTSIMDWRATYRPLAR